jgi:3'-phosphoadenosine 5'-phosphosulfate sulfotransferase (PAPS reductase)/FAD synthetase
VTGERAEESHCRARYAPFEPHRTDKRASPKFKRHVDHWRPVHALTTEEVWTLLERWRINPHPAYRLGWGRVSCAGCIFGSPDQWASLRAVNPAQFEQIAAYEQQVGVTIRRDGAIAAAADRGMPYVAITPADIVAACSHDWQEPIILPPDVPWTLPAGAFGDVAGPT